MDKIVTFDLETVPDRERSAQIQPIILEQMAANQDGWKHPGDEEAELAYRMATTPEYCRVVAAAFAIDEDSPRGGAVGQVTGGGDALAEADLLRAIWKTVDGAKTVITFNGGWFDLRVLKFRSALLSVGTTRPEWVDLKPWDASFVDVFRLMYPNRKYVLSLKRAVRVFNLPVPEEFRECFEAETAGADVGELVDSGRLDELVLYNRMDVALTRELHRLFGGFYWLEVFRRWGLDEYDYQRGIWVGDAPAGF